MHCGNQVTVSDERRLSWPANVGLKTPIRVIQSLVQIKEVIFTRLFESISFLFLEPSLSLSVLTSFSFKK